MRLLLALLVAGLQLGRAEPEIHLIPAGFSGWVAIAHGAANGEAPAYEGDARLYRIPRNGILLTQAPVNTGSGPAYQFFLETSDGVRQRLAYLAPPADTPESRADPRVGFFSIGRGSATASAGCQIVWDTYFVGTNAQFLDGQSHRFDSGRTLATIYRCPNV